MTSMSTATANKRKRKSILPSPPPTSPPRKRLHISNNGASIFDSSPFHIPSFPCSTPARSGIREFPPIADSPTNPFGRTRAMSFVLPSPTPFGKHLALRFQLTRQGVTNGCLDGGPVYRIAQVPLGYTFRMLRLLLVFLFDGPDAVLSVRDGDVCSRGEVRARRKRTVSWKKGRVKEEEEGEMWPGHVFEVKRDVMMLKTRTRNRYGEMDVDKSSTCVKLSSVRDPYRFRDPPVVKDDGAVFDDDSAAIEEEAGRLEDEEEGAEWRWEAEEHMTLAGVWPAGPSLTRGVVYHHDPCTQVHITVNTLAVPRRKGAGNTPFVFIAKGRACLDSGASHAASDKDSQVWNAPGAFERFLSRIGGTSGLDASYTYPTQAMGTLPSTSMVSLSLPTPALSIRMSESLASSSKAYSDAIHAVSTPIITPGPAHPIHRRRLDHAQKRMTRLAEKGRKGLVEFQSDTEEEEEVDELIGDGGGDDEGGERPAVIGSTTGIVDTAAAVPVVVGKTLRWRQSMKAWEPDDPSEFED